MPIRQVAENSFPVAVKPEPQGEQAAAGQDDFQDEIGDDFHLRLLCSWSKPEAANRHLKDNEAQLFFSSASRRSRKRRSGSWRASESARWYETRASSFFPRRL